MIINCSFGPTQSGKTVFVSKLLKEKDLFQIDYKTVYFVTSYDKTTFKGIEPDLLERNIRVVYLKYSDVKSQAPESLFIHPGPALLIFDDFSY